MSRPKGLLTLLSELAVIVIGVLIALGVDEWNDTRRERVLEQEYIARLVQDLEVDLAEYEWTASNYVSTSEHAEGFLAWLRGDRPEWMDETVVTVAHFATRVNTPDHVVGAYEELVSTGRLNLIRDPALRARLAHYYAQAEARQVFYHNRDHRLIDYVAMRIPPAVRARVVDACAPSEVKRGPLAVMGVSEDPPGQCAPELGELDAGALSRLLRSDPEAALYATALLTDLETANAYVRFSTVLADALIEVLRAAFERP